MIVFEIPTSPRNQKFTISLAGVKYSMSIVWNSFSSTWVADISDSNKNKILSGIPMVAGVDLLEQVSYLGIGGKLVAVTDNNNSLPPTLTNLGSTGHLLFIV